MLEKPHVGLVALTDKSGYGGYRTRVLNIINALQTNFELYMFSNSEEWFKSEQIKRYIALRIPQPLHYIPYPVQLLRYKKMSSISLWLGEAWSSLVAFLSKKLGNSPYVYDMHGIVDEVMFLDAYRKFVIPMKAVDRKIISEAEAVLVVSETMKDKIINDGTPSEKIHLIPNGVDLAKFNPSVSGTHIRDEYDLQDKRVIGYIGRFGLWQCTDLFPHIIKRVVRRKKDVHFLFVGEASPARTRMQKMVNSIGLKDHMTLVDGQPYDRMPFYLAAMDICFYGRIKHPAMDVALPTKFVDYLAMGKPVITTNVGDPGRLISKFEAGIAVPPKNFVKGISNALLELTEETVNIKKMGKNARMVAEKFYDWKKIGIRLNNALTSILEH